MEERSNSYKKWSNFEEIQLLDEITKYSILHIAEKHQRSKGAITSRLNFIGLNLVNQGISIEKTSKIIGKTSKSFKKYLDKHRPYIYHTQYSHDHLELLYI